MAHAARLIRTILLIRTVFQRRFSSSALAAYPCIIRFPYYTRLKNDYFSVGKADFEAFAALKMDSVGTEPDCEYGQVEPKPQNPMEAAKSKNQACGLNFRFFR